LIKGDWPLALEGYEPAIKAVEQLRKGSTTDDRRQEIIKKPSPFTPTPSNATSTSNYTIEPSKPPIAPDRATSPTYSPAKTSTPKAKFPRKSKHTIACNNKAIACVFLKMTVQN
jgi:hypothetical protein